MTDTVTADTVRGFLADALTSTDPRDELAAWEAILGSAPLWSLAASYCTQRRHDVAAHLAGFDKSGASVVALIDMLKERAPGPGEPEVYSGIEGTFAVAWVWRTGEGAKVVVLERAPKVAPLPEDQPCPDEFKYWPDQWRQVRARPHPTEGGTYSLEIGGALIRWDVPPRQDASPEFRASLDDRLATPCSVAGCGAQSVAECGHKTMAEELGHDLPDFARRVRCQVCTDKENAATEVYHVPPECTEGNDRQTGPCVICKMPLCIEEGAAVCRLPGCTANPDKTPVEPLEHPDGSPAHVSATEFLQGDAGELPPSLDPAVCAECNGSKCLYLDCAHGACNHDGTGDEPSCPPCLHCPEAKEYMEKRSAELREATERSRKVREDLDLSEPDDPPAWCAVCEGADPASSDLPGGGHHPDCVLFKTFVPPEEKDTGIDPDATCANCACAGNSHDFKTRKCAQCQKCPGFYPCATPVATTGIQCQQAWNAHNGTCGADDCKGLDQCKCGHARATHSRPNDECSRCACVEFRAGVAEPLVTEDMNKRAEVSRRHRFAADLDLTKVRKQRKTKTGLWACELCLRPVKVGEEWVSRLGRSVRKRAHNECAKEAAQEMLVIAQAKAK